MDLGDATLRVVQVAVQTPQATIIKPYPKSRAGVRTVPHPGFLDAALHAHRESHKRIAATDLVFSSRDGHPLRRSNFRVQVWRPALVRAGLLGTVTELGSENWRASWLDADGLEWSQGFATQRDAIHRVALKAHGGLRFHDLRHSYATWLVSDGVPVNVVQRVLGHEQASTTLNLYTHAPADFHARVRDAFADSADFLLTSGPVDDLEDDEEDQWCQG